MIEPLLDPVPELSVVIPILDEEENLRRLLKELVPVLAQLGTFEIVFIDDGSTDQSLAIVLEERSRDPRVKMIELSRNFGQQAALAAGLDHARGRAVVLMDADLQDPPEVITDFVAQWRAGFEVVYGIRASRKEGPILRACFFVFYRLLQRLSETDLPLDSGDFCLMDTKVVDAIRSLREPGRFLRGQRGWVGFSQTGVVYSRGARHRGETKFSMRDRLRFAWDGMLEFADIPLRLAARFSLLIAASGAMVVIVLAAMAAAEADKSLMVGLASTALVVVTFQLLILGLISAHLARAPDRTRGRPAYIIRCRYGLPTP